MGTISLLAWIFKFYIIGAVSLLLTFFMLFRTTGYIVDKAHSKVKRVAGFGGIKSGRWYKLPEIKYVSLLRIKQASDSSYGTSVVQNSPNSFGYQVNLIVRVHKEERIFRLITTNEQNAKQEGKKLGEFLDLKVLDSTSHKR